MSHFGASEEHDKWGNWLDQIPKDQQETLSSVMVEKKLVAPLNGHSKLPVEEEDRSVPIVRKAVEDCMITDCPPYEDVMDLIRPYNALCFRHNLLIKGPKGNGKTLSVFHFAQETKTPLIILECSEDTKSKNLIGTFFLKGGKNTETPFILGSNPEAIDIANEYGRAILLFEEINALTPQIQKELNALLDFRTMVSIAQAGKTYKLREGAQLWAVATMNPSVYGGTYDLNEDLRSRWDEIAIGYPPPGAEKRILKANVPSFLPDDEFDTLLDRCIRLGTESRQESLNYALSSRDLVRLIEDVQLLGEEDALQLTACKFENDDVKTIIRRITSIWPNVTVKESWQ